MDWVQWQGVIGALGGVLLTGLIGLVTAKLSHGWQREQREDDRRDARADLRRDAYVAYLAQAQKVGDQSNVWMHDRGMAVPEVETRLNVYAREMAELTHQYDVCERRAMLVAGEHVQAALETYRAWFRQALNDVLEDSDPGFAGWDDHEAPLIDAMRRELDEDAAIPDR